MSLCVAFPTRDEKGRCCAFAQVQVLLITYPNIRKGLAVHKYTYDAVDYVHMRPTHVPFVLAMRIDVV